MSQRDVTIKSDCASISQKHFTNEHSRQEIFLDRSVIHYDRHSDPFNRSRVDYEFHAPPRSPIVPHDLTGANGVRFKIQIDITSKYPER